MSEGPFFHDALHIKKTWKTVPSVKFTKCIVIILDQEKGQGGRSALGLY